MNIEKSNNIEFFKLTNERDWADIMISENHQSGRITIASSFGTWSHYWGSCGEDFKSFLANMDINDAATKFKCANKSDSRSFAEFWRVFWIPFFRNVKHFDINS